MHSLHFVVLLALCAIAFAQVPNNPYVQLPSMTVARTWTFRPMWWLQDEWITACSIQNNLGGVTQCTVVPAFNGKPHQISIMVYGYVDGWVSMTTNGGGLTFPIKTVPGLQRECIHGTASAPGSDGYTRSCICDKYFAGPNCNTIWKVTVPVAGRQFVPLTYMTPTSNGLINNCWVSGNIYAKCTVGTYNDVAFPTQNPADRTQITITRIANIGAATLNLEIIGLTDVMKIPVDFQQNLCVHGFMDGSTCRCEEQWTGSDCNTPLCDRSCGHGFCANTGLDKNECICNQNYYTLNAATPCANYNCSKCKTDNGVCVPVDFGSDHPSGCQCKEHYVNSRTGGQCNKRLCDCNGLGHGNGICTCVGGRCTFTKNTNVFPGWCSASFISQECIQGTNNYPEPFGAGACSETESDPWAWKRASIEISAHIILALIEIIL